MTTVYLDVPAALRAEAGAGRMDISTGIASTRAPSRRMRAPGDGRTGVRRWIGALGAFLLAGILVSCSGGDEAAPKGKAKKKTSSGSSEEPAAVNIEDLQAQAQELLEKAKSAGMPTMSADVFKRVEGQIAEGDEQLESGDEAKAKTRYVLATKALKSFIEESGKAKEAASKLGSFRKEIDAAKKKADAAKAADSAPDVYKQAAEMYDQAVAVLDKPASKRDVDDAKRSLEEAKVLFEQAAVAAAENESFKQRATAEKEAVAKWKGRAAEKNGEEKAPGEWASAAQTERDADDLFAKGQYKDAVDSYKDAARRFTDVLEALQQKEMLAGIGQTPAPGTDPANPEGAQPGEGAAPTPEEGAATPPEEGTPGAPGEELPPVPPALPAVPDPSLVSPATPQTSIEVFEGYVASQYPQEIDAEDEAYLEQHYKELSGTASVIEYDSASGAVRLDYTVGKDVKKDITLLNPKSAISYENPMFQMKKMDGEDQKKYAPFSFSGNTAGFVCFSVPFRYYVRVNYDFQILTMDKSGTFTPILMLDRKKLAGYAAEWLKVGMLQGGAAKVGNAPQGFSQSADRWFAKTRAVPMVVEYRTPDPKKGGDPQKSGLFTVNYDPGGDQPGTNMFSSAKFKSGVVGFLWSRTKFEVRDLVITGILDKKAAVDYLRAKRKEPRAKTTEKPAATPGSEAEAEAPPGLEAGGDAGAAPEESAPKTKKSGAGAKKAPSKAAGSGS